MLDTARAVERQGGTICVAAERFRDERVFLFGLALRVASPHHRGSQYIEDLVELANPHIWRIGYDALQERGSFFEDPVEYHLSLFSG